MATSFNVIALISGGKDSFFSILHCIQNGHKVVALGNLYPPPVPKPGDGARPEDAKEDKEHDLNSFMFQTVGHTVISLYERALGIPIYRQQIIGTAMQTGTSYSHSDVLAAENSSGKLGPETKAHVENEDETESLVPLLRWIMAEHPNANALSTGAILSTYQRTRIESVALRLGLTPLSYLWKYPVLPPGLQTSLLYDMQSVGLDARIVKVASGGLNESFLWENVASEAVIRRVERSMMRFGMEGDGAVLGEGGEFETLVIDGPISLFKGRIEMEKKDGRIVREGGGSAWLQILHASVKMKKFVDTGEICRIPDILGPKLAQILDSLNSDSKAAVAAMSNSQAPPSMPSPGLSLAAKELLNKSSPRAGRDNIIYWTVTGTRKDPKQTIFSETGEVIVKIRQLLHQSSLQPSAIVSTMIILRAMQDFAQVNEIYGALFIKPNPPARVTISCGDTMPRDTNIIIHLRIHKDPPSSAPRKALHVQSRSYWAPANIGPYSQATCAPISSPSSSQEPNISTVSVAGQIPLIPSTMLLPSISATNYSSLANFNLQTVLSLQHLWRIGQDMHVTWWTSATAYLPHGPPATISTHAAIAGEAWRQIHAQPTSRSSSESESEAPDLWEEKHHYHSSKQTLHGKNRNAEGEQQPLPDWDVVAHAQGEMHNQHHHCPPFFIVEVEELPRGSGIEWHAHVGIEKGVFVKLHTNQNKAANWIIHQCHFGGTVQSVIMVSETYNLIEIAEKARDALQAGGVEASALPYLSYLDVEVDGVVDEELWGGFVPCRSIWDGEGGRLSAVLIFDTEEAGGMES